MTIFRCIDPWKKESIKLTLATLTDTVLNPQFNRSRRFWLVYRGHVTGGSVSTSEGKSGGGGKRGCSGNRSATSRVNVKIVKNMRLYSVILCKYKNNVFFCLRNLLKVKCEMLPLHCHAVLIHARRFAHRLRVY